jgi:xanthine/CO dehydrogenase XdhC/CoxF family maturation factor
MSSRRILEAFDRWRAATEPLVLATVVETEGSTYTKAGHRILLTGTGEYQGLVSGGCLEGDLGEHAREVLATGDARLLTYDLREESDELFGLGIGCNGLFRVLLQPVRAADGYAPMIDIARVWLGESAGVTATVVDSSDASLPAGATLIHAGDWSAAASLPAAWRERLLADCRHPGPRLVTETLDGHSARVLVAPLQPIPRLLILGAGLDAVPLLDLAARLGWRVTITDHRPAYLARSDLAGAEQVLRMTPRDLPRALPLDRYAAAVVMSHHLATDRAWLAALARTSVPYVGLLGPAARRDRLLRDLGADAAGLRDRLHAPVGLPIGADSPESIALAILAEIQATMRTDRQPVSEGSPR